MPRMTARAYLAALEAVITRQMEEKAYCIYVTDTLRALIGGGCQRYADWIDPKPADTRTGTEIAVDVIRQAGLVPVVRKGGEA